MHKGNLLRIDDTLAVKAHLVVLDNFRLKAFHVVNVRIHGVEALYTGGTSGEEHIATSGHHFNAIALNLHVHALSKVTAGNGHAKHAIRCGHDFIGIQNTERTFQGCHQQRTTFFNAKFAFGSKNRFFYLMHHSGAFTLRNTDTVSTTGYANAHVFLPVRRVEAVNTDNNFSIAVINALQRVIQAKARCVLLIFRYGVFQIEDDAVTAINVSVLNETRLLGIHEHHGTTQSIFLRLRSWYHFTIPPQGIFAAD